MKIHFCAIIIWLFNSSEASPWLPLQRVKYYDKRSQPVDADTIQVESWSPYQLLMAENPDQMTDHNQFDKDRYNIIDSYGLSPSLNAGSEHPVKREDFVNLNNNPVDLEAWKNFVKFKSIDREGVIKFA